MNVGYRNGFLISEDRMKEGRKEVLSFNDARDTFIYTVMWCPTYC